MNRLLITLATRNRPQLLLDTIKKSMACWTHPNTRMVIQTDTDDYATNGMLTEATLDERVSVNMQKREDTVAAKWNRALKEDADLYVIAADDNPCITPGFDTKMLEAAQTFPDGICTVWGHLANASFPDVFGVTRKFANIFGYIFPEYFPYWFADHWTCDVAQIAERVAFADVRGDLSKAPPTMEMREPAWWATWFDAAYLMRRADAHKLIDALDEPDWKKNYLRTHHPHIEFRSRWVNDNVRSQKVALEAANMHLALTDPRYQRMKQAAVAMLPNILNGVLHDVDRAFWRPAAQDYALALMPPQFAMAPPQIMPQVRAA